MPLGPFQPLKDRFAEYNLSMQCPANRPHAFRLPAGAGSSGGAGAGGSRGGGGGGGAAQSQRGNLLLHRMQKQGGRKVHAMNLPTQTFTFDSVPGSNPGY